MEERDELEELPDEDDDLVVTPERVDVDPEDEEIDRAPQPGNTPAPDEDVAWPR